jgi:cell division protein FtsB
MTNDAAGIEGMRAQLNAVETRVEKLESRVDKGFAEVKDLIRSEIADLKGEQIKDHKRELDRLADDQRRVWDHIHAMDENAAKASGSRETLFSAGNALMVLLGGVITVLASWLLGVPFHH